MTETKKYCKEEIHEFVVETLKKMTGDWDTDFSGPVDSDTKLIADLGFESIDVVQLVVAFEEEFKRRDLGFEQLLMKDGRYVDELRVGEIVGFLDSRLNGR